MNKQEDRMYPSEQFMPETVDEQIDQFSRLSESETVNGQFINDLSLICKEYIERRDRAWERIEAQARERYGTEQMGIIPNGLSGSNFAWGQQNTQQRPFPISLLNSRRRPLELIAAVLIAVLVVGSMLWLVGVTHTFAGGTIVASWSTSSQASSKPVIKGIVYPNLEDDIQYLEQDIHYSFNIKVETVFVKAGDQVKQGQTLMNIDIKQIDSQIQVAQVMEAAKQSLLDADKVIRPESVARDQQQLQLAISQLQQLQLQQSSVQGDNLMSTMNGVVTQINVNAGQTVSANTPLLAIMDESIVVVHAKVPQTFISQVGIGQAATVTTSALPGRNINGKVTQIIPTVDPKTHTFEVWVSVPNSTMQLLPGMDAEIQIQH